MTTKLTNKMLRLRSTRSAVVTRKRIADRSSWDRQRSCEVADDDGRSYQALQVLIVADASNTAESLAADVRKLGHDAHAICTGCTASTTGRPDVVLLDIESIPFGEWQSVERIRNELARPDCLIVALSRDAGREYRQMCREAGIDVVLGKPLEPAVMETLLLLECTRKNRLPTEPGRSPWL